jgi:hypothetical protein
LVEVHNRYGALTSEREKELFLSVLTEALDFISAQVKAVQRSADLRGLSAQSYLSAATRE